MSETTSPSMGSLSVKSPWMADFDDTDATSQTSTSSDNQTFTSDSANSSINDRLSIDLPWILHRILECQLSCELPLRIMFAYNSGQRLPTLKQVREYWSYSHQGKLLIAFLSSLEKITPSTDDTALQNLQNVTSGPPKNINRDRHPSDRFMDNGNESLLNIDFSIIEEGQRNSNGLPQAFVQKVCLQQFFPENFEDADFRLALTGLDYIRDFEITRRAALCEAAERLGITKENWREVLAKDPDAKRWVENIESLEIDVSDYYASTFIDLRIWTLIKELQSEPFYKPNLLAMLNTLFPPSVKELPNDKIDKATMYKFRAHFYDCILRVEKHGPRVLKPWLDEHLRIGSRHSWSETRKNLVSYFDVADTMIDTARLVYDLAFFRDRHFKVSRAITSFSSSERPATAQSSNTFNNQSNFPKDRPATSQSCTSVQSQSIFPRERPMTGQSGNSLKSQRSGKNQVSAASSAPTSYTRDFNSFSPVNTTEHSTHQRRISSLADEKVYFEPPKSPWLSHETLHQSMKSSQSLQSGSRDISNSFRPRTLRPDTAEIEVVEKRAGTLSRAVTPVLEQGSEAAKLESFTNTIPPFKHKRQAIIARRDIISQRSQTALGLSHAPSYTPMGAAYNSQSGTRVASKSQSVRAPTPLLNDDLEFLKRPYKPEPSPTPKLKKMSSLSSIFQLRKKSSASSIATMQNDLNIGSQSGLGIVMERSSTTRSTETFPRFSQDARSTSSLSRKQASFSNLEKTDSKLSIRSMRSRTSSQHPTISEVVEDEKVEVKGKLIKKSSLPNMSSRSVSAPMVVKQKFVATGDDYEAITLANILVPAPLKVNKPDKKVRKAKSFAALRSGFGSSAATPGTKKVQLRKSSTFRREPEEGDPIRGKTISEPFPMRFYGNTAVMSPESQSKEWTRQWLIAEAYAQRNGMNPPEGNPIRDFENERLGRKAALGVLKREMGREAMGKEFESPRATPKPPIRPDRQRWDVIFSRRPVESKKMDKHVPVDTC